MLGFNPFVKWVFEGRDWTSSERYRLLRIATHRGIIVIRNRHEAESMEEPPRRVYSGSLMHFLSDLSLDGLCRALLGVATRQFGSGSALSAVGQKFWNAGHRWRLVASRTFVFLKQVPDFTENPPFAFTACHGHDRFLC